MKITIIWISYFLLVLGISIFAGIKTGERVKIYLSTEAGHNELCQKIFNEIAINHGTAAALIWEYDQMRNSQDMDLKFYSKA